MIFSAATISMRPLALLGFDYSGLEVWLVPQIKLRRTQVIRSAGIFRWRTIHLYNPQYASLYMWRTMGRSNYNAMQLDLKHKMTHGVPIRFTYTFSKSIDLSSDAERVGTINGTGGPDSKRVESVPVPSGVGFRCDSPDYGELGCEPSLWPWSRDRARCEPICECLHWRVAVLRPGTLD